jgi:hypothetical protein
VGEPVAEWGIAKRILFRFAFVYLLIYNLTFPLSFLVFFGNLAQKIGQPYGDFWNALVPWVGTHLFGVTITVQPNGSGDTTYNYVQVFCYLVISLVVTAIWSLLDRRRANYSRMFDWLRVWVRFSLAFTMLLYGAVKIIQSQFPAPSLDRLLQPFGDSSPMGLLWTFMGASRAYNLFTGLGEFVGGLLLTTRRTTLLGALVSIGVLGHVAVLNLCYDVPVKLFSLHLLAMAAFLALPDLRRVADVFILNRGVEAAPLGALFPWRWMNIGAVVVRTVIVLGFATQTLWIAHQNSQRFGNAAPKSPLYGIWNVEQFEIDGKAKPPLVTDTDRWRRVIFDYPQMVAIQLMSDSRQRYVLQLDEDARTLALSKRDDANWKATINYQRSDPDSDLLALEGKIDGHTIRAQLRRRDPSEFLLGSRGFHWINEYPFNR